MVRMLWFMASVAIAATLASPAPPARAQAVQYDCYDADGNLRQRGVSRSFALGYLGYSDALANETGPLRSSRGTCLPAGTLDSSAPSLSPAAIAILARCQERVSTHFQNLPLSAIDVAPSSVDEAQGLVAIAWRTQAGAEGVCRIDRSGAIVEFVVQTGGALAPASTPTPAAATGWQQDFGAITGIGRFAVLRDTYRDSLTVRQFDALVNGERQRWWANCRTEAIGRDRQAAPINPATRAVHQFVCSDRL